MLEGVDWKGLCPMRFFVFGVRVLSLYRIIHSVDIENNTGIEQTKSHLH